MTAIQWTDAVWNPVVGCSPVSEGCRNCYAAKEAIRLAGNPHPKIGGLYAGTSEMRGTGSKRRAVFTGKVSLVPERLGQPLRWRKPRRVFVNSMSDLFHEAVPVEFIAEVFHVMAATPEHTYQILTKRPERMAKVLNDELPWEVGEKWPGDSALSVMMEVGGWPLPNVWLGASVEDQAAADERIPHLLRTPAAVRFLSCEPLLGPVDLRLEPYRCECGFTGWASQLYIEDEHDETTWHCPECEAPAHEIEVEPWEPTIDTLHWVIVGGESGPGARSCDVAWIRSIKDQCQAAGVPVFVKQLGAGPYEERPAQGGVQGSEEALANLGARHPQRSWYREGWTLTHTPDGRSWWIKSYRLRDRKGGDPAEWPEDLRVREYPEPVEVAS